MTKQEAIEWAKCGAKVTHRYFDKTEWLTILENGDYLLEDGVVCSKFEFWRWRTSEDFDTGWDFFSDPYTSIAAKTFHIEEVSVTDHQRDLIKSTYFGRMYGGSHSLKKYVL